ncbi:MAG: hypothetical protein M1330_02765 [Armatimonadetes bacterium]|nr:hypothetical protein [Armatimonadota bacterium]
MKNLWRKSGGGSYTVTRFWVGMLIAVGLAAGEAATASTPLKPNGGWGGQWSPNGRYIAFFSQQIGEPVNLWVMKADGRNPQQLTIDGVRDFGWSSDGRFVDAEAWHNGRFGWYAISLADRRWRDAWPWLPHNAQSVAISRNGKLIAYLLPKAEWREVWLADFNGAHRHCIAAHGYARHLSWSPDGRQIAFDSEDPHIGWLSELWIYNRVTGKIARVKQLGSSRPAWSPNSKELAFCAAIPPNGYLLALCDVASGTTQMVAKTPVTSDGIAWSPDGKMLAEAVQRKTGERICLILPTGTITQVIGDDHLYARYPQFSPDGKWVLFEGQNTRSSCASEVWIARTSGEDIRRLTPSFPANWEPAASPDGRHIAYLSTINHRCEVWIRDSNGGHPKPIGSADLDTRLIWSPDGRNLLEFSHSTTVLWKFKPKLSSQKLNIYLNSPIISWSPDSSRILYSGFFQGRKSIMVYPLSSGIARPLFPSLPQNTPGDTLAVWGQQGKKILFVRRDHLWIARSNGSSAHPLAALGIRAGDYVQSITWASASRCSVIALLRSRPGTEGFWELRCVSMNGHQRTLYERRIRSDYDLFYANTSPPLCIAGEKLLFTAANDGVPRIWSLQIAGGKAKPISSFWSAYPAPLPHQNLLYVAPVGNAMTIWHANSLMGEAKVWLKV